MSDWWLKWHTIRLRRTVVIHNMLQKYGPVVRIGPNKIALSNLADVHRIYGSETFPKSIWYDGITFGGIDNVFNERDPALHAYARRWCAPTFRRDALCTISLGVREVLGHLAYQITDNKGGSATDVLRLFQVFALDVTLIAIVGTQLNLTKSGQSHPCIKHLHNWIYEKGMATLLPTWLHRALRLLPSTRLRSIFAADPAVISLVSQLYEVNADRDGPDLLSTAMVYTDVKTGASLPRDEILAQAAIFVAAGTDTMSIALTYIAYELALNKDIVNNIRAELAERSDLGLDLLKELPYLNAFLKEVLRVHGPAPMFLERVVPIGGAALGGRMLPAGTVVGAQAWTAHRNREVFPDPLRVHPERWVELSPAAGRGWMHHEDLPPAMQASYFPFGQGARGCIGRPLAEMVLLLVTATLATQFDSTLHASTTPDSMEPLDIGAFGPQGKQCMLYFVRK